MPLESYGWYLLIWYYLIYHRKYVYKVYFVYFVKFILGKDEGPYLSSFCPANMTGSNRHL